MSYDSLFLTLKRLPVLLMFGVAALLGAQEGADSVLAVTVTAARTPDETLSVSSQVHVISADAIAASGATSVVEVLRRLPGVNFTTAMSGAGTEQVSMRGFGENSFGRVLVLVDGKRLNNPDMQGINWNAIPLSQVQRIEVLDGTASVEYGNNAVGGVINIITKKDSPKAQTRIAGLVGSFFTNQQSFSHQGNTDWGSFSVIAEHTGSQGFRKRQASQTTNAAVQATVNLGPSLALDLHGSLADLSYQLPGSLTKTQFEADPSQAINKPDEGRERDFSGGAGFLWVPSDRLQLEAPVDYTAKFSSNDNPSFFSPSYTDRFTQTGELGPKITATVTLADRSLRIVGGADLYGASINLDTYSDLKRSTRTNTATYWEFTGAPYATLKLDLLPNLFVNGGLRYDGALLGAKSQTGAVDTSIYHNALVYDGGLTYRPWEPVKVYAKYGTLFRYPFVDEQAEILFGTPYFNTNLKPETGYNAEGGVAVLWGKALSFNGNLYLMDLRDEIAFNSVTFHNENLDPTRRVGSNLSLTVQPTAFLELRGTYAYVDATFTSGPNNGKYIPLVPTHSGTAEVSLLVPGDLRLSTTAEYHSEAFQSGDTANTQEKIAPYTVYGAQVRWALGRQDSRLTIQGTVKNLLDTHYAPTAFWNSWTGSGYYPADGRSFSLQAEYRF